MGPTASGKTEHAIALSQRYPFQIISVDSAQVYRRMNIGTAKPSAELLQKYPHRLIDKCEPWENYSAGHFVDDAVAAMREISAAGKIPLLVGGTMLYFQALQRGLARLPKADAELRALIDQRAAKEGWPALHEELNDVDPAAAARLKPEDSQRIQRALEVYMLTGEPISKLQRSTQPPLHAEYLNIGLLPSDRQVLHQRIAARFAQMLDAGFEDEVRALNELPQMSSELPSMRAVGYRQLQSYLSGAASRDQAVEQAIVATRRLAKRQLTWLRDWPELQVVDSISGEVGEEIEKIVSSWIEDDASLDISR